MRAQSQFEGGAGSLEVRGVSCMYRDHLALENVGFTVSEGTCMAILGPNGAGKSTLLKVMAGLLKAESGEVIREGNSVRGCHPDFAYLPQCSEVDWDFPVTVRDVVEMGRFRQLGWWRPFRVADRTAVDSALELFGMADLHARQIRELSGGQQQRVFLARAIAQEAKVLLLDEPFAGLDIGSLERLAMLLKDLADGGHIVICSHHDLESIPGLFDTLLLLKSRQLAFGNVSDVLTMEHVRSAYGWNWMAPSKEGAGES